MTAAQRLHIPEIAFGRHDHAAIRLDRLEEHRCDLVGRHGSGEQRLELGKSVRRRRLAAAVAIGVGIA